MRSSMDGARTDRWSREIELQKVFGLTPSEAMIYTSREAGESVVDIATSAGLSTQTVKNTMSNAHRKIRREVGEMEFFILKPMQNNDSAMIKSYISNVVVNVVGRICGAKVDNMTHLIRVAGLSRSVPGDVTWMDANVFRYVDLQGLRCNDDPMVRVERIVSVYNEKMKELGETEPKMGFAVLKYCLDRNYITYDIMEGKADGKD